VLGSKSELFAKGELGMKKLISDGNTKSVLERMMKMMRKPLVNRKGEQIKKVERNAGGKSLP